MKIGNKLIIGFMVIASLVGLVGIFSVISHNNIQTNSKIITEVLELGILLDESMVELLALSQTENIKDYVREKTDYEQIRAEFDALFKKLDEENEKELQDLGFNIEAFHKDTDQLATISNRLIALHKRELAKNKASKEKKSLEKELRYKTRATLFALQDNALTRDVEQMQYKSKEALYQYKDQRHCIEWLDSISKIKDNSLVVPSHDISKELNAYERVAQDLSKIIVEQETIEAREHLVLGELQEHINLLEENTGRIVNNIKAESKALAKNTHLITFAVIVSAFLVSIILGLTIARSISKPVSNLAQTTQAIAQGDFSLRLNITTNDEIGDLAESFNDMAGKLKESHLKLKESHIQLEEKVKERVKEINCLYSLSKLIEQPEIPLGAIFQEATELIRNAYRYPDISCVRITFNGVKYKTDNFDKSELSQHAEIRVRGEEAGDIEVYCLGEEAEASESPFLQEESDLLDAVAEHLGRIAERTQAGEKLQLFRNLIDRSNDCIFLIEPKWGRFLDVNDRLCDSLGYTREELLTMSFKDIEESIRDESAWQRQTEKLKVKSDLVIQGRHKCKDATTFYAETSLKYVSQGKEDYIIAVARDITERKRAEETLQKSKEFVETIFNSVNDSISVIDTTNFKILGVNRAFLNTLKMEEKDVIGKHCYEVTHLRTTPCGPPDDICPLAETLKTAEHFSVEHIHYDKNRREINVEVSTSPIKNEKGEVYQVVHATRDITERKQAEEKQAGLLETVESINKELKDFAYIVSHDLKAPLRGIKTLADWIATDYADMFDEEGKERVSLLLGRTVRMHNLIDGILQYSRVGREKVKRVRVNLNELVSEVIEAIVPPENIEIRVENELPIIECEETRIMQVFQNLLSNAVKYMDKSKGQIKVGCIEEYGFWKFSIADNGPGIEEAHYERIFQIFQTLSPRDEVESTGVGLSVVKKIVELYGGKIWVESKPGEGSTFFFTLPKQESEVVDDAQLEAHIVS